MAATSPSRACETTPDEFVQNYRKHRNQPEHKRTTRPNRLAVRERTNEVQKLHIDRQPFYKQTNK
jgi:hypothetical protein